MFREGPEVLFEVLNVDVKHIAGVGKVPWEKSAHQNWQLGKKVANLFLFC